MKIGSAFLARVWKYKDKQEFVTMTPTTGVTSWRRVFIVLKTLWVHDGWKCVMTDKGTVQIREKHEVTVL